MNKVGKMEKGDIKSIKRKKWGRCGRLRNCERMNSEEKTIKEKSIKR
jgi:hypothetical protein